MQIRISLFVICLLLVNHSQGQQVELTELENVETRVIWLNELSWRLGIST